MHIVHNMYTLKLLYQFLNFILQTCKSVYDKIIDLRIATPQIVMNYGLFLEENNYFEEAFKVQIIGHLHYILFLLDQLYFTCNAVFPLLYMVFYTALVYLHVLFYSVFCCVEVIKYSAFIYRN